MNAEEETSEEPEAVAEGAEEDNEGGAQRTVTKRSGPLEGDQRKERRGDFGTGTTWAEGGASSPISQLRLQTQPMPMG